MDALTKAFSNVERSYAASKATVSALSDEVLGLSRGLGGSLTTRSDLSRATEQLDAFRGWVFAAVRPIAQRIAGQPIHVGFRKSLKRQSTKQLEHSEIEPSNDHALLDMLSDPSELMVAWSLIYISIVSLELTGRQLWWLPIMDGRRRVFPIPSSWIVGFRGTTQYETWLIRPPRHAGEPIAIPSSETVYLSYPSPSDPHGVYSPLMACAAAVHTDEQITRSQRAMFERGIHPSHAIIVGKQAGSDGKVGGSTGNATARPVLTGRQKRQLIDSVQAMYAGACKHGEAMILDGAIEDVKRLSNTASEMDWLDSGKMTKERIFQSFGTNPIIAGEIEGANRASSHAAEQHFCSFTVNPKITLLSQSLTEWLRPIFAPGDQRFQVWIEPCVAQDSEMDLRRMQVLAQAGAITPNELRSWAGLGPLADWGDVPIAQTNLIVDSAERFADQLTTRTV